MKILAIVTGLFLVSGLSLASEHATKCEKVDVSMQYEVERVPTSQSIKKNRSLSGRIKGVNGRTNGVSERRERQGM